MRAASPIMRPRTRPVTWSKLDGAYGRRGGHLIAGARPSLEGPLCNVCRKPILTTPGRTMHYVCDASTPIGKIVR